MNRIKSFDEFINNTPMVESSHNSEQKEVSGLKEVIEIVGLGKMKAKLDSGNTAMNALIVQDYYEKNGKVKFEYNKKEYEYPVEKHIRIWHHGKSTERPVIKVDLIFNGKTYKDEFIDLKISDLTGTKNYRSRMLLCKDFMTRAKIIIDPSKTFKLTDEKDIDKPKKKSKKKVNESKEIITMKVNDNNVGIDIDFNIDDVVIGGAILTRQSVENIINEYYDSVEDFNERIFKKFDMNKKLYNLEDLWINKEFRGNGYSRKCLELLMEKYSNEQMTLRAFPDGDVGEETLVRIYSDYGFVVLMPTEKDGTIMGKYIN